MKTVSVLGLVLGLAASGEAQTQPLYFHHAASPVSVPGGTTNFFLDGTVPTATTPTVEQRTIATGATQSYPEFTSLAFGADTTLLPVASVQLNLSASQQMRGCADVAADLFRVDGGGGMTIIGGGTATDRFIAQGAASGTAGFAPVRVEFALSDRSVATGEGIAITPSVTSHCSVNRRVFLAYDSGDAQTRVRFQCCFTVAAKCAGEKIKEASKKTACLAGLRAKEAAEGESPDPAKVMHCEEKLSSNFADLEAKGGCITTGDAPIIEAKVDAFVADLVSELNPSGPPAANKCQGAKIKLAGKKAVCLLGLEAKAAAKGNFLEPLDPSKVATCQDKLSSGFGKLEAKGDCATTGDAGTIEGKVDAFVTDVSSELACPCP